MNIQGYQKLTLLDFPGKVACTVFTGGCNLRCPFCHNGSLVRAPGAHENALEEVLAYLRKRRGLLDAVCISGGEPLLQPDLAAFILQLKEMGYLVKLDTNGALPQVLQPLLTAGLPDYVAMDVKSSPAGYPLATGIAADASAFLQSIELIRQSGIPHEFRTTVVKGIHKEQDLVAIARVLGDETYFLQGFVDSGDLLGEGCAAFSPQEMQAMLDAVRIHTPRAALRGVK
ncbi:MAG: anaerobic ribonucleoside-triphosphate reductase activating protein [Ruminococcaceae bacterium]|nr:anaerobic ribonucleoside-triphosphate reductase activating protein [Oscillospiraceae bacterium]